MLRRQKERAARLAETLGVDVNANFVGRRTTIADWTRQADRLQDEVNARVVEEQNRARQRAAIRDELQERMRARRHQVIAPAQLIEQALEGYLQTYKINNMEEGFPIVNVEFARFMQLVTPQIDEVLRNVFDQMGTMSVSISAYVWMVKAHNEDGQKLYVTSKNINIFNLGEIGMRLGEIIENLIENYDNLVMRGSGWIYQSMDSISISIDRLRLRGGGSYVKLPTGVRGCINVKNEDNLCFMYAVLAGMHDFPVHPERVSLYRNHLNELNIGERDISVMGVRSEEHDALYKSAGVKVLSHQNNTYRLRIDDIPFPVTTDRIPGFEVMNDIGIHILILNGTTVSPERRSDYAAKKAKAGLPPPRKIIVLMRYKDHYVWVKDLSKVMSKQISRNGHHLHFCMNCLNFTSEDPAKVVEHEELCLKNDSVAVFMPNKGDVVQYKHQLHKLKVPFVIYGDLECVLEECNEMRGATHKYQKHVPCGFCLYVVSEYEEHQMDPILYRGADAEEQLVKTLIRLSNHIHFDKIKQNVPLIMSDEDQHKFENATTCHICEEDLFIDIFGDNLYPDKVRDHDHLNGKFRGAAHNNCNLNFNVARMPIPVLFHNMKGYDAHHIIKQLALHDSDIKVIAQSGEKYISFGTKRLRFLDSLQFISCSLGTMVENLADKVDRLKHFHHLKKHITKRFDGLEFTVDNPLNILTQKGVYCYDWADCMDKFSYPRLPPQEAFKSKMTGEPCSDEDYERAQMVWDIFGCRHFGDYHDLYLMCDVLQLADVFENFRRVCIEDNEIDPCHSYTLPGYAWVCMLKRTKVKIGLMSEIKIQGLVEGNIKGGMSTISHRHAKANNPMVEGYDPSKPKTWIIYTDMNALYGGVMGRFPLPCDGGTEIDDVDACTAEFYMNLPDDGDFCDFVLVDLDYPEHLHDLHNRYPLAPESKTVDQNMCSEYTTEMKNEFKAGKPTQKLLGTLENKRKYLVHSRLLKFYLQQGLKLKRVHRVIRFKQSKFMQPFIDFNTEKRKGAQNAFEKDLYKLKPNATFGKTSENKRKHSEMKLLSAPYGYNIDQVQQRFTKLRASPFFDKSKIITQNLVAVSMHKEKILLDKPMQIGFAILELSKLLMFKHYYEVMMPRYGPEKAILLFTDTDSQTFLIETEDVYKDMREMKEQYDFSNYPEDHPMYSTANKGVPGKMKDETAGVAIDEFIGVGSKLYSLLMADLKRKMACKGVGKTAAKGITHEQYRKCVLNVVEKTIVDGKEITTDYRRQRTKMRTMQSVKHEVHTVEINKVSLSAGDDKRYLREKSYSASGEIYQRGVASYAYGHWRIKREQKHRELMCELLTVANNHGGDAVAAVAVDAQPVVAHHEPRPGNLVQMDTNDLFADL
jgi:hypothetical protein